MSLENSLVSVVLPTYNRAETLSVAIDSVLAQTHGMLELIVVDDASSDDTPDLMQSYSDPRIRYIRLERNGGASRARNEGLKAARGDFVAFQDSDDEWLPNKLEKKLDVFAERPDVGVVYCDQWKRYEDGRTEVRTSPHIVPDDGFVYERALAGLVNNINTPVIMVRKSVLDEVGGFDEELAVAEDMDLLIRLSKRTLFSHVPEPLMHYNFSESSLTGLGEAKTGPALLHLYEKYHDDLKANKRLYAEKNYWIGSYRIRNNLNGARGNFLNAFLSRPFSLRYAAALAVSLCGSNIYSKFHQAMRG